MAGRSISSSMKAAMGVGGQAENEKRRTAPKRRRLLPPPSHHQQQEEENQKATSLNPNWEKLREKLRGGRTTTTAVQPLHGFHKREELSSLIEKTKETLETEEKSSAAAVLTPRNSDCSLTDLLAMDCEMVGVSFEGKRSALGRVALVNKWGNIVYDEYVRPLEQVVDFRTEISGIKPHHLKKAKDFSTVQKNIAAMMNEKVLVGHALQHDLKALLLSHPKRDTRDTSSYKPFKNKEGKTRSLRDLAFEHLGINIQQKQHCPVEDARAAMLIYLKHRKDWERHIWEQRRDQKKQKKPKIVKTALDQ